MNFLGMLRNIPIDPVVQQALDAHPREPLVVGVKAWFYSMGELIATFILSLSPGWNIDTYIRVVYHSWFKRPINELVNRRQEAELIRQDELARQARMRADEIKEEENELRRESEASEEWPDDGTIFKERKRREIDEEKSPEQHIQPQDLKQDDAQIIDPYHEKIE